MTDMVLSLGLPLVFVWAVLLGAFWLLELLPWKPGARVATLLRKYSAFHLEDLGALNNRLLLLVSALGLFLELLLIRWLSSEVRIFAFFKNLALVGCFFGFGLGCYLSKRTLKISYFLVSLLALVVITCTPWPGLQQLLLRLSDFIAGLSDVHVFDQREYTGLLFYAAPAVALSVILPLLTLAGVAMVPMGQMVSRVLEVRAGVGAYSLNVAASIVGIWVFTGLSFMSTPPVVWFAVFGAGLLILVWKARMLRLPVAACFLLMMLVLALPSREFTTQPRTPEGLYVAGEATYWSPYQKLTLVEFRDEREVTAYTLRTNGSWYQRIVNLNPDWLRSHPGVLPDYDKTPLPYHRYNLPFRFKPQPENVLILGAGMGNDVAAAVRNGAKRIVAVEIDPLIQELGKRKHLEKPYDDPRVVRVVNDARAYMQNTPERFDLIISSILDSHMTQSSFTNIRTDNYVYTREGLGAMLALLKPDGVMSVSFSIDKQWFGGRIHGLLTSLTGKPPLSLGYIDYFFLVGDAARETLERNADLRAFVQPYLNPALQPAEPTTDDWPYFYHRYRGIPIIVMLLSVLIMFFCWAVLRATDLRAGKLEWHFFFLGVGFMLMEVQIISKLALVFGTTWLVNSIAISVLLGLILLANLTASRVPGATGWFAYAGLVVALALCYAVPVQSLLFPSFWMRVVISSLVLCSPVYFAGLIFISSFARAKFQAEALGSNLFGSVVGGMLESLSFLTGIRALVLLAGLGYFGSLVVRNYSARAVRVTSRLAG